MRPQRSNRRGRCSPARASTVPRSRRSCSRRAANPHPASRTPAPVAASPPPRLKIALTKHSPAEPETRQPGNWRWYRPPMHFVITVVTVKPDSLDAVKEHFEASIPPVANQFSGWRGAKLTADREQNRAVVIGSWADADQMRAFLAHPGYQEIIGGLAPFFAEPPQVTVTELITEVGPQ